MRKSLFSSCLLSGGAYEGTIERYLKTVNYFFAHQIPGAAMAKLADRGDYDPQRHALLTMGEFKHLFEKWVLDVYAQTTHRGLGTTPWAKWHEGLARRTPQLPADLKSFQRRIGLVRERALRPDGVNVEGIRYADDSLLPLLKKWGLGPRCESSWMRRTSAMSKSGGRRSLTQ